MLFLLLFLVMVVIESGVSRRLVLGGSLFLRGFLGFLGLLLVAMVVMMVVMVRVDVSGDVSAAGPAMAASPG